MLRSLLISKLAQPLPDGGSLVARFIVSLTLALAFLPLGAAERRVPTVDDLLNLKSIGGAQISPDGTRVVYTQTEADFGQDAFVTQLWMADARSGQTTQLTRGQKSSSGPQWSPDGKWIGFTSPRADDKNQVFVIDPRGGEAIQLTKSETAVSGFVWAPDSKSIAYSAPEALTKEQKDRKERLGDYEVVRREYQHVHLWTIALDEAMKAPAAGQQRTRGKDFSVGSFSWAPDGHAIAFAATRNPDLINGSSSDIYTLSLADDRIRKIVSQPGFDTNPEWSPDSRQLVFSTAMGRELSFAKISRLAMVSAEGGTPRSLTDGFDEVPSVVGWNTTGLYFSALQKTAGHLFRLNPGSGQIARVSAPDDLMGGGFTIDREGNHVAFTAGAPKTMSELYVSDVNGFAPKALTDMTAQAADFIVGSREVIAWKSKDGALIEGVLIKPADFDSSKRYPLLCIIHGGPTGIDRPILLAETRTYPADIWVGRGALVLKVNYRGSAGYGEKFRSLNVGNLGVGDAWDVLSGIDYLIQKGWVDPARIGCMGWSQGGYISAFLTTTSDRFKAISVGAGISNWATYYYNTDITPFTINYLGEDPADDPAIYAKTSPMAYVRQAKTPTLIQHGELDRRVPIPNGYELRQGLEDRGVPVEMIVYKGFGHGITKPRAQRAVMQHNLSFFNHYIWGDARPDFLSPPLSRGSSSDGSR
jgi:dipeptidyl aminopeptidase/acylaminoacyl peptidase